MIKPSFVVGVDGKGKSSVLWFGEDVDKGKQILDNPGKGIVEAVLYRRPPHFRRKSFAPNIAVVAKS